MSSKCVKRLTKNFPLFSLGLVCFVTTFLCQTYLKVTPEEREEESLSQQGVSEHFLSMTYRNSDICGYVLKTSFTVTSPILSATSTVLLLLGVNGFNPYYFLPWIILTFQGFVTVQRENIGGVLGTFLAQYKAYKQGDPTFREWGTVAASTIILIFNIAELYSFYEIVDIFRLYWNYRPYYAMIIEKQKKLEKKLEQREPLWKWNDINSL